MKFNIKKVVLPGLVSLACLVSTFNVYAQERLSLSLQQAMDMALERNNTLANAALDIKIAQANKWAAIASMLPQISAISARSECETLHQNQ